MPASVALFSQIVRIEDGIITNSGAITDASIAAVLSGDTVEGALSEPDGLDSPIPDLSVMMAVM